MALPVGNPLWTLIRGRVDLRNHRKLMIVDNRIAWCGSQNCRRPGIPHQAALCAVGRHHEPLGRPGRAPLPIPVRVRLDGRRRRRHQRSARQAAPIAAGSGTIVAQVHRHRPDRRFDAMPACFAELIHSAREELVVTTPYFVPDEQLLFALTSGRAGAVSTRSCCFPSATTIGSSPRPAAAITRT